MNIRWPEMCHNDSSLSSFISEQNGFWITSESILGSYSELGVYDPFIVKDADFNTLLRLQGRLLKEKPERVCAIGGGKVLDLAKLAVRLGSVSEHHADDLSKRKWINASSGSLPYLTVIPSTAGSGSETSEIGVLTIKGVKVPLHHPSLLPDQVVLFSEILDNAPIRVLWNGIWDTFVHAMESALSPLASTITRRWSYDSLRGTIQLVNQLMDEGRLRKGSALEAFWNCSLAGKAQSAASVGLIHALAHQAESENQWHGEACARVMPHVLKKQATMAHEKYQELSRQAGFACLDEFVGWVDRKVRDTVGEFAPVKIGLESRQAVLGQIVRDPCFRTNAVYLGRSELQEWLEGWFYE